MKIFIVKVCSPKMEYYFFKNLEDAHLFHFMKFYQSTKTPGMYVVKEIEEVFMAESIQEAKKFDDNPNRQHSSIYHVAGT